jgi:hypothetical protein
MLFLTSELCVPIAITKTIGQRPHRTSWWGSREAFLTDLGVFVFGAAGVYSLNVVGSLPGNEILLFPVLPVILLTRGRRAFDRRYLWFYVLTGAWLLGTLIADVYASSPSETRMKGTARVIFFALNFMALAVLINDKTRRIVIFGMSIAAVEFLGSLQFRGEFLVQWKFGISESAAIVGLLISTYFYARRRYWICGLISVGLAGLNLIFGFRSQLAILLVAAVLVLPLFEETKTWRGGTGGAQNRIRVLVLLGLAGVAAYAANAAIRYAAGHGFFDESTQAKFETQAGGDLGVLVGGRPETLVAIQAIIDKPIIGHGSFPYEPKYLQLKQDIQYEHGYSDSDEPEEDISGVIPTHSHLTMAWVESGILGGACWIYIFVLTLRGVLHLSSLRPAMAPLYSYFLVGFLWDILYSPFGSVNRIWGAFYILISYGILKASAAQALQVRRQKIRHMYRGRNFRLARRATY